MGHPCICCHDEVVVECDAERAEDVKAWPEKTMIEGMETVSSSTDEVYVPVEARMARGWGDER